MRNVGLQKGNLAVNRTIDSAADTLSLAGSAMIDTAQVMTDEI
jgi:hypothetical protein